MSTPEPTPGIDTKAEVRAEEQHATDSQSLLIFLAMLAMTMMVIWRFKIRRYRFLHETGVSIIIGLVVGLVMNVSTPTSERGQDMCNATAKAAARVKAPESIEEEAVFDPEMFFFVLLAPIIFNAGYSLKQKHFFHNIGTILTYAFIGTTMATFITGGLAYVFVGYIQPSTPLTGNDALAFGALISATDPVTVLAIFNDLHVDHRLYALVFGESVLNDAVAIVLYRTITEFKPDVGNEFTGMSFLRSLWTFILIFFGSFACGTFIGMASAMFFKFTNIREYPMLETVLFVLFSYSSFLFGEGFGLTGIVAILFCGIAQSHYTYNNLSKASQHLTRELFELLNFMAENFVFTYIGINFFTYKCHRWDAGFIGWSLACIILARTIAVVPLSALSNLFRRRGTPPISKEFQFVLVWAGLRGAIAVALAMRNVSTPAHQTILSTTLVIVLVTVLCFGGTTVAVLQKLKIKVGVTDDDDDEEDEPQNGQRRRRGGILTSLWSSMDAKYLRPVLVRMDGIKDHGLHDGKQLLRTVANAICCRAPEAHPIPLGNGSVDSDTYSDEFEPGLATPGSLTSHRARSQGHSADSLSSSSDEDMLSGEGSDFAFSGDLGDLRAWAADDE